MAEDADRSSAAGKIEEDDSSVIENTEVSVMLCSELSRRKVPKADIDKCCSLLFEFGFTTLDVFQGISPADFQSEFMDENKDNLKPGVRRHLTMIHTKEYNAVLSACLSPPPVHTGSGIDAALCTVLDHRSAAITSSGESLIVNCNYTSRRGIVTSNVKAKLSSNVPLLETEYELLRDLRPSGAFVSVLGMVNAAHITYADSLSYGDMTSYSAFVMETGSIDMYRALQ